MNHIASPDTSDRGIERAIQAKGKTGPRVTPAALKAVISSDHYFTAFEGVAGHYNGQMDMTTMTNGAELRLITICVLVLKNGFKVLGHSTCVSADNFDAQIGRDIARDNAEREIWPLLGYTLKEQLFQVANPEVMFASHLRGDPA